MSKKKKDGNETYIMKKYKLWKYKIGKNLIYICFAISYGKDILEHSIWTSTTEYNCIRIQ